MPVKWHYLLALILILGICFYAFYPKVEDFFVFFPQSSFDQTPEELGLEYEDVFFLTVDGRSLHGWFFPLEGRDFVILFSHGNAGNISHRLDNVRRLLDHGLQVFIYDYRGYGRSEGSPSEEGIYRDALAAWDYLVKEKKFRPQSIVPFGRSLGAAAALEVALRREVRSVILESGFTSTRDMAKGMFPFSLIAPLLPGHYNNLEKITGVKAPKLIIHGEEDEIVPFSMGKRLFQAATEPKFFLPLKGAGHNDTYFVGGEGYFRRLVAFVKDSRI